MQKKERRERGGGEGSGRKTTKNVRRPGGTTNGISCFRIRKGGREKEFFAKTCREYEGDAPFIDSIRSFFPPFLHLFVAWRSKSDCDPHGKL